MDLRPKLTKAANPSNPAGPPHWFARVVRSSFLSPRNTTALVDGTQPFELSADRLLKLGPMPTTWQHQLGTYGFV